ncbi:MAG: 4Fe-4S dicluster domain-containing protein [Candidatus Omnitrophota bacterium]
MKYAVISKSELGRWFDSLKNRGKIYGPKKKESSYVFRPIKDFEEMSLKYIPTILPPKKYYFPQKEFLFKFKINPFSTGKAIKEFEEFILFGVHTCDIAGIQCMDVVFNEKPADPNYLNRKEKMTIIGIECMDYCDKYASCAAVGTHIYKGGYDIMLTDLGDEYAMHINSEKGEDLVSGKKYIREMKTGDKEKLNKAFEEKLKKFNNEFNGDMGWVDKAFEKGFFSPVWKDVGKRCVGCTNCTAVCPTCYCFDVTDEVSLNFNDGDRYRVWNYCQMDDFAKVSTGEDFRQGRDERQRHRYYRKFKYSVQKYNKYFCTGCGRCTRACMAKISLIETVNELLGEKGAK